MTDTAKLAAFLKKHAADATPVTTETAPAAAPAVTPVAPEPSFMDKAKEVGSNVLGKGKELAGKYWQNLKGGDPLTVGATGAAALLGGYLLYNSLKKKQRKI